MFHSVMDITGFKFWIPVSIVNFGYGYLAYHFSYSSQMFLIMAMVE
jgi:hypothetical protein